MSLHPAPILLGLAVLFPLQAAQAGAKDPARPRILLAQATDGASAPGSTFVPPDGGAGTGAPGNGVAPAAGTTSPVPPTTNAGAPAPNAQAPSTTANSSSSEAPAPTGTSRNGAATLPTLTQQPGALSQGPGASSITFGGPQVDVQPVYGSPLRDSGAGNGGVPVYSSAPSTLGGPINGTANPYLATLPNGAAPPGQTTSNGRGNQPPNGNTFATQQPLGARPYTRDQTGTFGGTAGGYNAQGIYNGTAAQTGVGYGSPYATTGRPVGGLLSTGVDATGPLRPYIPLNNNGPIGRTNSGYGIPNGARSTHMDGRGIQRLD